MLARDYNFAKWDLIETMEIEHRLLKSLGLHQTCRDLVERMYTQQLCLGSGVNFDADLLTYCDAIQQLSLVKLQETTINLIDVNKQNIVNQYLAIKQALKFSAKTNEQPADNKSEENSSEELKLSLESDVPNPYVPERRPEQNSKPNACVH